MKPVVIASLIASAAAFAPAQHSARTSVATNMAEASPFANELGAQAPLGFFDPMGIVKDKDQAEFDRLRYLEIKHGRIAMMAIVGNLVTEAGVRFPDCADVPSGFAAFAALPPIWLVWMVGSMAAAEIFMRDVTGEPIWDGKSEFVGDFRNGYIDFGWAKLDEKTKLRKRAIELNQGRAAQMGILALMVHEKLGVSILPGH